MKQLLTLRTSCWRGLAAAVGKLLGLPVVVAWMPAFLHNGYQLFPVALALRVLLIGLNVN